MNVFIVFAHPSKTSYTAQVLEQLMQSLREKNHSIELSDLYAMDFESDMSEAEYVRETSGRVELPTPDDVQAEHVKINNADCIIFLYPVWWSDCPAKLKGWFDRVLTAGYAYKQRDGYTKMKTVTHGVALCTAGYSNEYLRETGIAQSMKTIMLYDRFGNRFQHKHMSILGDTLDMDNARAIHAGQIQSLMDAIQPA